MSTPNLKKSNLVVTTLFQMDWTKDVEYLLQKKYRIANGIIKVECINKNHIKLIVKYV